MRVASWIPTAPASSRWLATSRVLSVMRICQVDDEPPAPASAWSNARPTARAAQFLEPPHGRPGRPGRGRKPRHRRRHRRGLRPGRRRRRPRRPRRRGPRPRGRPHPRRQRPSLAVTADVGDPAALFGSRRRESGLPPTSAAGYARRTSSRHRAVDAGPGFAALMFLYRSVLGPKLPWLDDLVRDDDRHAPPEPRSWRGAEPRPIGCHRMSPDGLGWGGDVEASIAEQRPRFPDQADLPKWGESRSWPPGRLVRARDPGVRESSTTELDRPVRCDHKSE